MMVRASTDNYTRPRFQAKAIEYAVEKLKYELRLTDPKKQEKKHRIAHEKADQWQRRRTPAKHACRNVCTHPHI